MKAEKKGIIFDMDGTLWDSSDAVAMCWSEVTAKRLGPEHALSSEDIKGVMGKTMDVIARLLFPSLDEEGQMRLLDECCEEENRYLEKNGAILYPGLIETLVKLRDKYNLYIVSNCQSGYIEAFLNHYGIGFLFKDIECYGNNLLSKGQNIKLLADRNGLTKAVYVGDIQGDYNSACEAGVGFIHAKYGFGNIDADVPEINSITELPEAADKYFK